MTDITLTLRAERKFSHRLRLWLSSLPHHRTAASNLDTLSDHMLRDIGVQRDEIDRMQRNALRAAMWLRS